MQGVRAIGAGIVAAGLAAMAAAAAPGTTAAARLAPLAAMAPSAMDRTGVAGLSLTVISGCGPAETAVFGAAHRGRPLHEDTLFRVESISKPVTAWGVARLVQAGALSFDAPVAGLLGSAAPPGLGPAGEALTLRHLLNHTSGLPIGDFTARFPPAGPVPPLAGTLEREVVPRGVPGARFSYSDTGYNLAELVIEQATGADFAAVMMREVLDPLGMRDAGFDWTEETGARIATGHDLAGRPVPPYVYPGRASGGLIASAGDIAAFARAELGCDDRANLPPATVARLHAPSIPVSGAMRLVAGHYGLGHFSDRLSDGRRTAWHGGQGFGWMSHLQLVPETGDAIVLLSNSQRAWPLFAELLAAWSAELGVRPVGMARILHVLQALTLAMILAAGAALVLVLRVGRGVIAGRLRPAPFAPGGRRARAAFAVAAAGIAGALGWAATRDYLLVFSVAPHLSGPLAAACGALGAAAGLSALFAPVSPAPGDDTGNPP
jgi:CubicO group peptidase (beta-lactamase class C family)